MKWEVVLASSATWGESHVSATAQNVSMVTKGVTPRLKSGEMRDFARWEMWADRAAPNAKMVLRSQVPSLVLTSVIYALTKADLMSNLRSLVVGLGWKGYPWDWWGEKPLRKLDELGIRPRVSVFLDITGT